MAGVDVPVGTYTLFSIPEADKWTIILNKDLGQWGTYKYEQEKDFIRFEVPSEKTKDTYEPFTIMFDQSNGEVKMQMMWSDTMVEIPVLFLD
jgi:hypothetical protein